MRGKGLQRSDIAPDIVASANNAQARFCATGTKSFDWRARHAKPRPSKRLSDLLFTQARGVLN